METEEIPTRPVDWLKWLGDHRDGFLVGTAVLYGLGYLVWSYNAWQNHLGQLPAIEFQYIMAGLIPGAIIGIAWAATVFFKNMQDRIIALFAEHQSLKHLTPAVIALVALGISIVIFAAKQQWLNVGLTSNQLAKYMAPLLSVVIYFALLVAPSPRQHSSRFGWILNANKYYMAILFCWYSLIVYIDLYPHIPQELGGPQPRCAYVDLVHEDLAPSTLASLVPSSSVDASDISESKAVRSVKLNVYFATNDYLLVRTATETKNGEDINLDNVALYELRKEVIRAVQWCP